MSEKDPDIKRITIYPPQGDPIVYDGDNALGIGIDPTVGVLVRVRNADGDEVRFMGVAFSVTMRDSRVARPRGPLIIGSGG
jgi:hypothetical protein